MNERNPATAARHTLIVIGYMGVKRAYLDIPEAEAVRRYQASEHGEVTADMIERKEFKDEFGCYDIYE